MKKENKLLIININNQNYRKKIIKKYPKIKSGRKNYYDQYIRVLKNILLTKFFSQNIDDIEEIFLNKFYFHLRKKSIKINFNKEN